MFTLENAIVHGGGVIYGSEISVSCRKGFIGGVGNYVCSENGKWKPKSQPLTCQSIIVTRWEEVKLPPVKNSKYFFYVSFGNETNYVKKYDVWRI